jgi:hypothetical protein
MPRAGVNYRLGDESVLRFAYARYVTPTQAIRDTLGAFVDSYAGYAQTTNTLGLAVGVPRQTLANPFPAGLNPVIEPSTTSSEALSTAVRPPKRLVTP